MVGAICKLWLTVMMQSAVMMLQCLGPLCLQHAVARARSALSITMSDWIIMNLSSQASLRWLRLTARATDLMYIDKYFTATIVYVWVFSVCLLFSFIRLLKLHVTWSSQYSRFRYFTSPSFRNSLRSHYRPRSRPLLLTVSDVATVACCCLAGARVIQRELLRHDRW